MTTSRDWANEFGESVKWILLAFLITTALFALVAFLLLRYTKWGRQFWSVTGDFFRGRAAVPTLLLVAALLFMTVFSVRMNVLFSYWYNDMYSSLQDGASALAKDDSAALDIARDAFWSAMVLFSVLAAVHVVRSLVNLLLGEVFDIRWRVWLTERVTVEWLKGRAYYRARFIDNTIDNPDQRIQQDITDFVDNSRTLAIGAANAVVSIASFATILWDLSGPITILGTEIPRAMVYLVMIYVLLTTFVAFWIGHPLIRLNFLYQRVTADFRYALVRLRDSAENVAFYRGEGVEQRSLLGRFAAVISAYWSIVFRNLKFQGWNLAVSQTAVVFPFLLQGPRFFAGQIKIGDMIQTSSAFGEIHDALSFFRTSYDDFAAYRASLIRLDGLLVAADESRKLPALDTVDLDDTVRLTGVEVRRPGGDVLIGDLNLSLNPGDALVVKGASGSGKTTLLRALAQMWPYADGEIGRPSGTESLFLSQIPYLPLGDLRSAVAYPGKAEDLSDDRLREVLGQVHLGHLGERLDEEADWAKELSPGEQQRIAFARVLLLKPKAVFLDEATSAVDEGLEFSLYALVRTELPETVLVSVAHRSTVDRHHTQRLELGGGGPWTLGPIEAKV